MNDRMRIYAAVAGTVALFLLIQLGALALVEPFQAADYQAVEDPSDPTNSALFFGAIMVATVAMLAAIKYDVQWLIRGFIVAVSAMLAWYVVAAIVTDGAVRGDALDLIPLGAAAAVALGLAVYPEWYVIDAAGVLMGAGAAGMFGISFGLLPAILFLTVLAIYDAISVYGTEHMLTLAEGVMDLNVPVLLVVPTSLSYSFRNPDAGAEMTDADADGEPTSPDGGSTDGSEGEPADAPPASEAETAPDDAEEEGIRDALYIGLGDAVMPTILVASAAFFVPADVAPQFDLPVIAMNLPALTAMVGTTAGLLVLLRMVLAGRPHAGLPLLNGGTILGYLIGALYSGMTLLEAVGISSF